MNDFTPPFTIGDTYYRPVGHPRQVTSVCPICDGKLAVTVILGNGERVGVTCDGCGIGYQGPQGVITEWESDPVAETFVIAGIESYLSGRWTVRSTTGRVEDFASLKVTEAEALEAAKAQVEYTHQRNLSMRGHRRSGLSKTAWTVRYHRREIQEHERKIAWHRQHLIAVPQKGEQS